MLFCNHSMVGWAESNRKHSTDDHPSLQTLTKRCNQSGCLPVGGNLSGVTSTWVEDEATVPAGMPFCKSGCGEATLAVCARFAHHV